MNESNKATDFGAQLLRDQLTRFQLWAPNAAAVSVEAHAPDGRMTTMVMQPDEQGFFRVDAPVGAGTAYRFVLPDGQRVPDPGSRLQADDVHGPSVVVHPEAYSWQHPTWKGRPWHEVVLYELHPGAFGGFAGIERALPDLAELGVTAVELMPIADFPGTRNWGYDGVLPYAPDRAYGTPEELKRLIDTAHGLNMMVFLDVVYNHFGPDGNYLNAYAKDFFREDIQTPWGPSIDFRRPQVRQFFTQNAIYWVNEFRFDGLRFDAVQEISEPDWLDEMAAAVRASAGPDRHVHLVLEHDDNIASHLSNGFNAQWNDDAHHVLHRLLTDETDGYYGDYADAPAQLLAKSLSEGFIYQGQPSVHRNGKPRGEPSAHLPPTSFVQFLQNHDQIGNRAMGDRLVTLVEKGAGGQALQAATALVLLAPQIPMLFMGEEWGTDTPFLYFTAHHEELAEAVREGRRKEFAKFPAFADPEVRAAIPDPNAPATFHASIPQEFVSPSRDALLRRDVYRALLRLRREMLMPRLEGVQNLGAEAIGERAVAARWRLGDGKVWTVLVNLGSHAVAVAAPSADALSVFEARAGAAEQALKGVLPAACTVVFLSQEQA